MARRKAEQALPQGPARERLREKGQFWTPDWVADHMVAYALGGGAKEIFDPAVGPGAFFRAARRHRADVRVAGCELHADTLAERDGVEIRDFVLDPPDRRWEAIVANPPYIRHHRLAVVTKQRLQAMARAILGVHIDGRAGLHVYFLIRALERLAPGGRCAFIVPADIAEGVFASSLWRVLTRHFRLDAVTTFAPAAAPFPNVDTNALIVKISRAEPMKTVRWERRLEPGATGRAEVVDRELAELLATGLSRPPRTDAAPGPALGGYARVVRGIATGANDFFFLTANQISEFELPANQFVRALGRTRDLDGDVLTAAQLDRLDAAGRPTYLLALDGARMPRALQRYLQRGEAAGLPERPLLATRRPWYRMEQRDPPPFLFAYLGRRSARFIWNRAGVVPLTAFLCVYPRPGVSNEWLWRALSDPLTVANLARVGKSYGDGAIKVEPRALERLPLNAAACEHAAPPVGQLNLLAALA